MKFKRNIKNLSESEIIELAKKESYYFGILYDVYFEQIFRFVFSRLGGNESIAGDVTQETFLKAMANIQKYEDRGFPFSSWLYRIAQNEVSMYFRKSKKDNFVPVEIEKLNDLKDEIRKSGVDVKKDLNIEQLLKQQEEQLIQPMDQVFTDIGNTMHYEGNKVNSIIAQNQEVSDVVVENETIEPDEPVELSHKTPTSDEV